MEFIHPKQESKKVIPFIQNGDYFFHRGIIAYRKKHLQRAVKLFQRAVKLTNQEPVFHIQLAAVLSEIGHYEQSNDILRKVLEEHNEEEQVDCYFFMANNYAYLGLFDKAQVSAEKYITMQPKGNFANDAKDLLELLEFEYEDGALWNDNHDDEFLMKHERARVYLKNGDCLSAIPILEEIISKRPTHWSAYNHLAEALFRLEDERGFEISSQVLSEDESNLFVRANLALYYLKQGNNNKAEPYIRSIRIVYPIDYENYLFLAEVLCAAGDYEEVKERFERMADSFYHENERLLYCYAVSLMHTGEKERALNFVKKSASLGCAKSKELIKSANDTSLKQWTYHPWDA
ncbi:hypothetical protein BTS2_2522 [Bacillus sp. TS-2]|nr:hypothetical protein BTS2_2522 [Bacillus sp. TS-2]